VKHLCAEMAAAIEPARALLWYAAHAWDALPDEAPLLASLAKSHLAEVGTFVLKTATEVHGGIGFTDACDLHFWFHRAALDRQLLGGPEKLRARAADLQGWAS
jgi:alkylation response protein AidB-like acyl-CoA dehydrogenase